VKILSNSEFVYLTTGQAPRLQRAAKERYSKDPEGILTGNDIDAYKKVFAYSGDKAAVRWLDNLMIFTKNGTISRIRAGKTTWADHVDEISRRVAKGELPFDLGQHVQCKESGRYGSVVDYIPDSEEYLVVLDPFQVMQYKKGDLKKVAQVTFEEASRADSLENKESGITLEEGQFGWDYILRDNATGEERLIQTDYNYPGVASTFGWPGHEHGETDGTVDCPVCGKKALEMINEAQAWLDEHIGETVEDPGYFGD
jgi:hypothetical protein